MGPDRNTGKNTQPNSKFSEVFFIIILYQGVQFYINQPFPIKRIILANTFADFEISSRHFFYISTTFARVIKVKFPGCQCIHEVVKG